MRLHIALLVLSASLAGAETATVKGTVTAAPEAGTPLADAVVLLEGPAVPAPAGAPHATMDQRHHTFIPHVMAVAVGTTIDFPNHDTMLHNVFSASPAKKFDLGMYDPGESKSVTFDAPGTVEIRCKVHPTMDAWVVVHTNPWAAVTDAHGAYTIPDVPAGQYQVRVWHETKGERRLPLTVQGGSVQALDVRLEAPR
jgi:plastocyanin